HLSRLIVRYPGLVPYSRTSAIKDNIAGDSFRIKYLA
ncbi:MAG: hypothetical protein ACI8ZB_004439, partial [Desulforhopalus sp.]